MSDPAANPRKRRRWLRRTVVAILLVLVLSVGAGQFILWSDFPRNLVVTTLERQLGLRVEARSLSTGWFGRTTLRDVTAALPLADEIFLTVPRMDVSHTSLVRMIFGANLRLERIELQQPDLLVRQYVSGRWNVQEAVDVVGRATRRTGGGTTAPPARVTSASIPELRINSGTLRIVDKAGHETRLAPLDVAGERDGPIVYRYSGTVPDRLKLEGQLVPGGYWQHEFDLALTQPGDWLRPFVGAPLPDETALSANWRGQVRDGALVGRVDFGSVRAGAVTASGVVLTTGARGAFTFEPQRLVVKTGAAVAPELLVHAGQLAVDGPTVTARGLRVSGAGGNAEVNGTWDRTTRAGDLKAVWSDLVLREGVRQSGSFDATVTTVFPDDPRIAATLVSSGNAGAGGGGDWDARVEITGDGQSFNEINWRARFASARYDWRRDVNLTGLTIAATQRGSVITLNDVALPERGRLAGRGRIDLASRDWWLWLGGGEFALPRMRRSRLALDLNAWGTFDFVQLDKFYLNLGDAELAAWGFYDRARPRPVELDVWLTHLPLAEGGDERSRLMRGRLRADTKLVGTLAPPHLTVTGDLHGSDLYFRRYDLGNPQAELHGVITPDYARFSTTKLRLLDANWELEGDWPVDPEKHFALTVSVDAVGLDEVGDVFGDERLTGIAGGTVTMLIPEPRLDAIELDGTFTARDVAVAPLHAGHVKGSVAMRGGVLRFEPVELTKADGTATASGSVDLIRAPRELHVKFDARDWSIDVLGAGGAVGAASAEARVDLSTRAAFGSARFSGTFTREGEEVASAEGELIADGRVLRVMRLDGRTLGGTFAASGSYLFDDPNRTRLLLELRNANLAALSTWVPRLADVSGVYSGRLEVEPTNDPRALGPLGATLSLRSPDGGFRALPVNEIKLGAFANLAPRFDAYHLVTRDATLAVADGSATVFARVTKRRKDGSLSALVTSDFQRLSLDQIVRAAAPNADPMPGRLTGRLTLGGDPRTPRGAFGDAHVELAESDLGNFDPIGFLYDLMNVGGRGGGQQADGRGRISARIDNESLQVESFYLFNRGVEVRGAGAIDEVFANRNSPISGTLVGTARPLSALKLPFMADVDEILAVLQANATTVQVSGTLREPDVRPTTLDEVSDAVRALLLGDVRREPGGR